jgi:hypothetical protein
MNIKNYKRKERRDFPVDVKPTIPTIVKFSNNQQIAKLSQRIRQG